MLKTLDHRARLVALEAHTTDNVLQLVRNVCEDVTNTFAGFVAKFSPSDAGIQLSPKQREFTKLVGEHRYADMMEITAYVPEGLRVSYLEYLQLLTSAVQHSSGLMDLMLAPYSVFLSELVNSNEAASGGKRLDMFYPTTEAKRQQLNRALGACFDAGSSKTDVSYGQVIHRNADWSQVFAQADSLVQQMNRVDRGALQKKAKECSQLLQLIYQKLQKDHYGDMSPQVANNLASGAYQVASELEFFSVTYYKVAALAAAINRTMKHYMELNKAK